MTPIAALAAGTQSEPAARPAAGPDLGAAILAGLTVMSAARWPAAPSPPAARPTPGVWRPEAPAVTVGAALMSALAPLIEVRLVDGSA